MFIAQCTITRYLKPCIFVASASQKCQEEYIIPITRGDGKFPRSHYANPRFVSDRTGSEFLRRDYPRSAFREFLSLSLSLSLYVCEYKLRALWYVLYSVLPRASSRPLTPTNRRGRKASETFFYPYAILSLFEGFYYGYSNVVFSPCRGQAHPVTPTSLPAWIWDTADRKKLNGRIIFWKGHTRP